MSSFEDFPGSSWRAPFVGLLALVVLGCTAATNGRSDKIPELIPERGSLPDLSIMWRQAMDGLSDQLVRNLRTTSPSLKLAIFDLTSPQGGLCTLGFSIEEELTTRLFRSKRFDIVERRQLSTVMAEQRMSASEALDPRHAARLGRLLGAQAVLAGSVIHLADGYRLLPKIVLVETAEIVSVAEANIASAVAEKHGGCERTVRQEPARWTADPREQGWVQDFQRIGYGGVPDGWLGTDHYGVRDDLRGRRFFACRDSGPARFTIPVHDVPDDYRVEVAFTWVHAATFVTLQFGPVRAGLGPEGEVILNQLEKKLAPAPTVDSPITLAIEKRRSVFRVLVDGREVVFARYLNIAPSDSLILDLNAGGLVDCQGAPVIVHEVRVRRALG